ncbi:MAG TPA: hypothetical protein VFV27_02450 [Nevskiaceae bacterium]|nr:hypothetical protein [Nevskiaceae bacterium]
MAVETLLAGDIAGYFERNADQPGVLWLFLHIPKTAGTSFRAEIAERLKPQANICVGAGYDTVQQALEAFLQPRPGKPVRFASGHLRRPQAEAVMASRAEVRLITMLRSPVTRVVSDYRYQRTPKHPGSAEFRERFPDFPSYLRWPGSQNRVFEFLKRGPTDRVADVIEDLESRYAFVGLTEMYGLSRRMLFQLLGLGRPPEVQRRNTTEDREDNRIEDLESLLPELRALNDKDLQIYRHFAERLRARREAIVDYLRTAPVSRAA